MKYKTTYPCPHCGKQNTVVFGSISTECTTKTMTCDLDNDGCGYTFKADIWLRICKATRKIYVPSENTLKEVQG